MIPKKYRNHILRHHKHTQSAFGSILDHFGNFQKFRFLVIFDDFSKGPHLKKIKENPENLNFFICCIFHNDAKKNVEIIFRGITNIHKVNLD